MKNILRIRTLFKNYAGLIVFLIGMVFFRTAVADWNHVPSGSMEPTLFDGDWIWVDKTSYGPSIPFTDIRILRFGGPERGDIITFFPPHTKDQYVKRVIGLPGDVIRIEGRDIYVNSRKLSFEPIQISEGVETGHEIVGDGHHLIQYGTSGGLPVIRQEIMVPENRYFVLGDHRNNSADSRYWGFVEDDKVMGKVTHVAVSFSSKRNLDSRIAVPLN